MRGKHAKEVVNARTKERDWYSAAQFLPYMLSYAKMPRFCFLVFKGRKKPFHIRLTSFVSRTSAMASRMVGMGACGAEEINVVGKVICLSANAPCKKKNQPNNQKNPKVTWRNRGSLYLGLFSVK